jgi:hypothetical protein
VYTSSSCVTTWRCSAPSSAIWSSDGSVVFTFPLLLFSIPLSVTRAIAYTYNRCMCMCMPSITRQPTATSLAVAGVCVVYSCASQLSAMFVRHISHQTTILFLIEQISHHQPTSNLNLSQSNEKSIDR